MRYQSLRIRSSCQPAAAVPDRQCDVHSRPRRSGQPADVAFSHDRAAVPAQRLGGPELAGQLSAGPHAPHVHQRRPRRGVPAGRRKLLGHLRRHRHGRSARVHGAARVGEPGRSATSSNGSASTIVQDNNLPAPRRIQTETRTQQTRMQRSGPRSSRSPTGGCSCRCRAGRRGSACRTPRLTAVGTAEPVRRRGRRGAAARAHGRRVGGVFAGGVRRPSCASTAGNAFRAPALYERFGGGFSTDPVTGRLLFTAFGDPRLEPDRYQDDRRRCRSVPVQEPGAWCRRRCSTTR